MPLKFPLSRQVLKDIKNTPKLVRENTETAVVISICALTLAMLAFIVVIGKNKNGGE